MPQPLPELDLDTLRTCNDIADLFGLLFHQLDREHVIRVIANEDWSGAQAPEAETIRQMLKRSPQGDVPREVREYLEGGEPFQTGVPAKGLQRAYTVAQCIDLEFAAIHPRVVDTGAYPHDLKDFLLRYHHAGRYSSDDYAAGVVLPRGPLRARALRDGHPQQDDDDRDQNVFEEHFPHLAAVDWRGRRCRLAVGCDREFGSFPRSDELTIGFVPLAELGHELRFRTETRRTRSYLEVEPHPAHEDELVRRAEVALEQLAEERADVVVFPELCVSPAVREAIAAKLRTLDGGPSLVIAGSTAERGLNECSVFTRRGQLLFVQRKLNEWTMVASTASSLGIDSSGRSLVENMTRGDEICVIDVPGIGRMMVLICEDLKQEFPGDHVCRLLRPDWIFAPLLDTGIRASRWHAAEAVRRARAWGCRVVVATPIALECRWSTRRQGADPDRDSPCGQPATHFGVGMVVEPDPRQGAKPPQIAWSSLRPSRSPQVSILRCTLEPAELRGNR